MHYSNGLLSFIRNQINLSDFGQNLPVTYAQYTYVIRRYTIELLCWKFCPAVACPANRTYRTWFVCQWSGIPCPGWRLVFRRHCWRSYRWPPRHSQLLTGTAHNGCQYIPRRPWRKSSWCSSSCRYIIYMFSVIVWLF